MTPLEIARQAQAYADTIEPEDEAPWQTISDAYLVAADAWLEAGDEKEAAHQLLQAAEYRRWAIDDRENVVPGGIARTTIDMRTGRTLAGGAWQRRLLPVLSLDEAAHIAKLAGWLEPHPKPHPYYPTRSAYPGELASLPETDPRGRLNQTRLEWLARLTGGWQPFGVLMEGPNHRLTPDAVEGFRKILANRLGAKSRDPQRSTSRRGSTSRKSSTSRRGSTSRKGSTSRRGS